METTMTLALATPVELGGTTYSELKLREPTVGEMEKALQAGPNIAGNIFLVSTIGGLPEAAVRKMGQGDFMRAVNFFERVSASIQALDAPMTGAIS
jgi:hypothetical protein